MIISMLQFLDATLKNSEQGKNFLQSPASLKDFPTDFLSIQYTPAQKSVPTEGEFLTWLRYGEIDKVDDAWRNGGKKLVDQNTLFFAVLFLAVDNEPHALEALTRYVKAFPDDMRTQMIFSRLGTGLLQAKQIDKAVVSYELYTQKFPQSPQAFHGLSEAYELAGEKTKSVQAAKNVLELLDKVQLDPKEKEWLRIQAEKRNSLPLKQ
jgi:tetratricopeptide (TPR) repeat protein